MLDVERKGSERSFREFGYESIHLLVELPEDLREEARGFDRPAFEVQLRTILQEAWAEVEHELVYKAEFTPFDEPMKRKLAALNANLSLSDIIFQEILDYQRRLNYGSRAQTLRLLRQDRGRRWTGLSTPMERKPGRPRAC